MKKKVIIVYADEKMDLIENFVKSKKFIGLMFLLMPFFAHAADLKTMLAGILGIGLLVFFVICVFKSIHLFIHAQKGENVMGEIIWVALAIISTILIGALYAMAGFSSAVLDPTF